MKQNVTKEYRDLVSWHYRESWGKEPAKSLAKRCSYCGDPTTTRRALKRDRFFYCSASCSIAKDGELAIIEEAISKRQRMRAVK